MSTLSSSRTHDHGRARRSHARQSLALVAVAAIVSGGCDISSNGAGGAAAIDTVTVGATTDTTSVVTSAATTKAAQHAASSGEGGADSGPRPDFGVGFGVAPYHACVIQPDHAVTCFGKQQPRTVPPDDFTAIAVASGHLHNCALLDEEGHVGCFGFGYANSDAPNQPPEGIEATAVTVGEGTSCAIETDGTVACWFGGDLEADPPDGLRAKQVATTAAFSCAIDVDDEVVCWGLNPPELPASPLRAKRIVVAQSEATMDPPATRVRRACAIRMDDTVVCWGDDQEGEIADVPDDLEAVDVAIGHTEACAVSTDGELVCWGQAPGGHERPDGTLRARAVRIAGNNGCALRDDEDRLFCWGFADPERYARGTPDDVEVFVPVR